MNWRLIGASLIIVFSVDAQACERAANVLPDGNVLIKRDGPKLNLAQFRTWLLQVRKQDPKCTLHLYVRSEAAFEHENGAMEQIQAAGFDIHKVPID